MRFHLLFLVAASFAAGSTHADQLDDAIKREMARRQVPGLAIAVVKDGKIVREGSYGFANVEHSVPVTPKTMFQSGSVGKTFTAALLLLLAQDGKLGLDDPVSRHLGNTPAAWDKITIRHLLTHTSGLGDPFDKIDLRKDYTDAELIALGATVPTLFAPGERFNYSNLGYHLLGFICTKVGGKFYGEQLRERIFQPLGMGARTIDEAAIIPHRAAGYEVVDGQLRNQSWVSPSLNTTADGTLYLSARDLALWDAALYGDKVLDKRLREASWTPARLNDGSAGPYGYGWYLGTQNGHRSIYHGGAWQGFKSNLTRYVDDRLTVVVLANAATARVGKFAEMVAAHYVPALAPVRPQPITDPEPALKARVREAIARLAREQAPEGLSDSERARFTPRWIRIVADELRGAGPLQSVELIGRSSDGASRQARYRFSFRDETMIMAVKVSSAGLIDRLGISLE